MNLYTSAAFTQGTFDEGTIAKKCGEGALAQFGGTQVLEKQKGRNQDCGLSKPRI
jgi:hypothetical protein